MQRRKWTASALAVETGIDRRAVADRLSDIEPCEIKTDKAGKETRYYWGRDAFPAIYDVNERLSPRDQRESAQARRIQLEIDKLERRSVDILQVIASWKDAASKVVQRGRGYALVHPEQADEIRAVFEEIAELPPVLIQDVSLSENLDGEGMGGRETRIVA